MQLELTLADEDVDGALLDELHGWLSDEAELRGCVRMVPRAPEPSRMGGVSDTLTVALASGGAVSALAASLRVWFAQPRRSDIRIKVRTPDGAVVDIDARRVKDAEALLSATIELARESPRPAEGGQGATAGS